MTDDTAILQAPHLPVAPAHFAVPSRERPVFLDETGRRARLVRLGGRMMAIATAVWAAALVLGASAPLGLPSLRTQLAASRGAPVGVPAVQIGNRSTSAQLRFARVSVHPRVVADKPDRTRGNLEARVGRRA